MEQSKKSERFACQIKTMLCFGADPEPYGRQSYTEPRIYGEDNAEA